MLGRKKGLAVGVGALLALILSACGQQAANDGGMGNMPGMASGMPMASGMDPNMPGMGGNPAASAMGSMEGMNGGSMEGMNSNAPYDAQFIDSMIEHHTGAITMAEDALKNAERQEIKDLAQQIINDQQKEVAQLKDWRQQWYPDLAPTGGMGMSMGDMTVGGDASQPYDQRFIAAMIEHHNGAIAMANDALNKAERQEIKDLAQNIITAQKAEVAQLQQWNKEWFGA